MPVRRLGIAPKDSSHILPLISTRCIGRIVQQIFDEMSSGYCILLFLSKLLFDAVNSFTGIGANHGQGVSPSAGQSGEGE